MRQNNENYQRLQEADLARRRTRRLIDSCERRCACLLLPVIFIAFLLQLTIIVTGFILWVWYNQDFDCIIKMSNQECQFGSFVKLGTISVALSQLVLFENSNSTHACRAACERLVSLVGTLGLLIYLSCFIMAWYFVDADIGTLSRIFSFFMIGGFLSIVSPGPLLMIYVCFSRCCCFNFLRIIYYCFPNLLTYNGLKVRHKLSKGMDDACVICLEPLSSEDSVFQIESCKHTFHRHCLLQWMEVQATCPLCRTEVPCWTWPSFFFPIDIIIKFGCFSRSISTQSSTFTFHFWYFRETYRLKRVFIHLRHKVEWRHLDIGMRFSFFSVCHIYEARSQVHTRICWKTPLFQYLRAHMSQSVEA